MCVRQRPVYAHVLYLHMHAYTCGLLLCKTFTLCICIDKLRICFRIVLVVDLYTCGSIVCHTCASYTWSSQANFYTDVRVHAHIQVYNDMWHGTGVCSYSNGDRWICMCVYTIECNTYEREKQENLADVWRCTFEWKESTTSIMVYVTVITTHAQKPHQRQLHGSMEGRSA